MKKICLLIVTAFTCLMHNANAQNEIPDSLYGVNSVLMVTTLGQETGGNFMLQPDGKIVFGGYDYDINANDFHIDMMRFDQCGLLDSSFGTNGLVRYKFDQRNKGDAFKLQPDGKIVCAGLQAPSNFGSQQTPAVSRFNADGTPDSTFNGTGTHTLFWGAAGTGEFYSVFVMPDGRILCMGYGAFSTLGAMRFLPNGTLDLTFDGDGQAVFNSPSFPVIGEVTGHLLQNGKMVLTSFVYDAGFNTHYFSVQFDSTGVLDTAYGAGGFFLDTTLPPNATTIPFASALDANENLLLAGNQDANSIDIIRLTPEGELDTTFGTGGYVDYAITGTAVKGITVLANGNILVRGGYAVGFGIGFGVMLLPDGTVDTVFAANGFRTFDLNNNSGTHSLDDLLELPDGKWLAAGSIFDFNFKKYANQTNVPHISESIGVLSTTGTGSYQWYLNGSLIPSAMQNTHTAIQNGIYTVLITDSEGCTYLSDPFTIVNVSVIEVSASSPILYPNPVSDQFVVQYQLEDPIIEVLVTDATGRVVEHAGRSTGDGKLLISAKSLSPGIYFLSVITNYERSMVRFVKN